MKRIITLKSKMSLKTIILKIVLGTAALAGLCGLINRCGCLSNPSYQNYQYDGKIGEERVVFKTDRKDSKNTLEVTGKDGTKLYVDLYNDGKINAFYITRNGKTEGYQFDRGFGLSDAFSPVPKGLLEDVREMRQKEFDAYLLNIRQQKPQ